MIMTDLKKIKVCRFNSMADKHPCEVDLITTLRSFKGELYKDRINKLRGIWSLKNFNEYSVQKRSLQYITFCGLFKDGHSLINLVHYNSLMIIDIDNLDKFELNRIWSCLSGDDYVFSFWRSPSGMGIKGLVKLAYNKELLLMDAPYYHKNAFNDLSSYFFSRYGINIDTSGSDISRLCFISFDPELVIKDSFLSFDVDCKAANEWESFNKIINLKIIRNSDLSDLKSLRYNKRHLNAMGKNNREDRNIIEDIISYLTKKHLSITRSYDDWYRVAFAIADTFTCDIGEKYFLKLSKLDGTGYDEIGSKKLLMDCYDNSRGRIKFGTLIEKAQGQGYILRGGSKDV